MKNKIKSIWSRVSFPEKTAPLVILTAMLLAFGIYIPMTGFYWDDWPIVYLARTHGNFWQYYQSDRLFMALPEIVSVFLFYTNPMVWQVAAFLIRWGVAVCFWWCLRLIWPKAKWQTLGTALIFSVYPVFTQQPLAITYKSHFITFLFFFLSMAFMLLAVRKPKWFYLLTGLALLSAAVHLLIMEYFWGLELLRPVFLGIILSEKNEPWKDRLKSMIKKWLPYLVVFGCVLIWRFLFLHLSSDRNTPTTLIGLIHSPFSTLKDLTQVASRDVLNILISTWARVVDPLSIQVASLISVASWALVVLTAILIGFYLFQWRPRDHVANASAWGKTAILVGILAVLVGMIPVWATDRMEMGGMYSDRLAIPAMIGASLFVVGLINFVLSEHKHRLILVAMLVGLSAGTFFRLGNEYRRDWLNQKAFYWQLYWRAPAIQPGTALLTEGGIFQYVTQYSLSTAIDSLYPVPNGTTDLPYWSFELDDLSATGIDANSLQQGVILRDTVRSLSFGASSLNSLVIYFQRDTPLCLWVVTPADSNNPYLGTYTAQSLAVTNLERLLPEPTASNYPDPETFGNEPMHTWCYFFEKADLARQFRDWKMVTSLGDQVTALGYTPGNSYEWIPFIEGYIHEKYWDQASSLTYAAYEKVPQLEPALCDVWSRAVSSMTIMSDDSARVEQTMTALKCGK